MCAQHTAWERANDAARKGATAEVSDQITTASTQEREREAETSTSTTDRWILTSVASSVGSLCRHTIATSTVCMILILVDQTRVEQGTRGPGPEMAEIVEKRGPGDQGTRGPAMAEIVEKRGPGDQGTRGPAMAEINARTLMFNLGPEDAIDLTTSAKIARYTERKQLAYNLTDEGVLLLDGRGKKIHLKNGVVTLRNALGLHALPERIMTNVMREDVSLQGQRCCAIDSIGDNIVLTTDPNLTKQTNMLHVRKMALVDPQLLKSLHENTTPQPPVDKILRDLDAEMTSILKSDAGVSEKVPLYNQLLLRYNEMTKMHAAIPTPVVVMKSNTVDNEPVAVVKSNTVDNEPAAEVTAGQSTELVNIVATLPKTLQEKGRQLLGRLSKVEWNERGELMHEGVAIPGSNAVDLVHDLIRNRKTARDPVGWHQFAKQTRSANIPLELVGNVARRKHMQKPTPTKRIRKSKFDIPTGWEPL